MTAATSPTDTEKKSASPLNRVRDLEKGSAKGATYAQLFKVLTQIRGFEALQSGQIGRDSALCPDKFKAITDGELSEKIAKLLEQKAALVPGIAAGQVQQLERRVQRMDLSRLSFG